MTVCQGETREESTSDDPLEEIRVRLQALKAAQLPELPPFTSGAVGYAGYDVVRYTEHLPDAPTDDQWQALIFGHPNLNQKQSRVYPWQKMGMARMIKEEGFGRALEIMGRCMFVRKIRKNMAAAKQFFEQNLDQIGYGIYIAEKMH